MTEKRIQKFLRLFGDKNASKNGKIDMKIREQSGYFEDGKNCPQKCQNVPYHTYF